MARYAQPKLPYTLLSLPRYAEIMGFNPIQFMSGLDNTIFPNRGNSDRWVTYAWQDSDRMSRYDLAVEIKRAENEVIGVLGTLPKPGYIEKEQITWPRYHRNDRWSIGGLSPINRLKAVRLNRDNFISGGVRAVESIGTATTAGGELVYTDSDGDGVLDTATITLATALTSTSGIKLFYPGFDGDKEWEIQPIRSISIAGGNVTIVIDAWWMFDLDVLTAFPGTDGYDWLALSDNSNLLASVDVYRVYTDTEDSVTFYWESYPNFYQNPNSQITQDGYLEGRMPENGFVTPRPGTYSNGWSAVAFTGNREPDRIEVNYLSGLRQKKNSLDEWAIPDDVATAIAYIATARYARPECIRSENVRARLDHLTDDLAVVQRHDIGEVKFAHNQTLTNPFGTRRGEVEAWRILLNDRISNGDHRVETPAIL